LQFWTEINSENTFSFLDLSAFIDDMIFIIGSRMVQEIRSWSTHTLLNNWTADFLENSGIFPDFQSYFLKLLKCLKIFNLGK
jgi:hypothetical protein